jgi:hypothetical protein
MAVEPVTSVKTTVTVLRTSRETVAVVPSGVPHLPQKRISAGFSAPHDVQIGIGEV